MSQEYAWPSSSQLEFEARRLHAAPGAGGLADRAPAMLLSGLPQAFDTVAVAIAAALVFPRLVYPSLSPAAAIAVGLGLVVLAPAIRWLRLPLFAVLERRHGRGVSLTAARVTLGVATAAIAFLPSFAEAGAAALGLLVASRLVQGLAMSGLGHDARAPLDESRRARAAVFALTGLVGLAAAVGASALLAGLLPASDFLQWGWRYPFMIAIALNTVALFADLRLLASGAAPRPDGPVVRLATVDGLAVASPEA